MEDNKNSLNVIKIYNELNEEVEDLVQPNRRFIGEFKKVFFAKDRPGIGTVRVFELVF